MIIILLKAIGLGLLYLLILADNNTNSEEKCDISLLVLLKYVIFYIIIHNIVTLYSIKEESIDMLFITRIIFTFTDSCKNKDSAVFRLLNIQ